MYLRFCLYISIKGNKKRGWGIEEKEGAQCCNLVQRISVLAHFSSPGGGIHQPSPRAFPSSNLIHCSNGHVAASTHVIQEPQMAISTDKHVGEIHTPLRCTHFGPFHSLNIPLAVSHQQPQLLLISWVTLHARWASLLGGTAVDVFWEWGWGVGDLVIVNIFVPPPPSSSSSTPVLCCVIFLRDPCWTA